VLTRIRQHSSPQHIPLASLTLVWSPGHQVWSNWEMGLAKLLLQRTPGSDPGPSTPPGQDETHLTPPSPVATHSLAPRPNRLLQQPCSTPGVLEQRGFPCQQPRRRADSLVPSPCCRMRDRATLGRRRRRGQGGREGDPRQSQGGCPSTDPTCLYRLPDSTTIQFSYLIWTQLYFYTD